MSRATRWGVIAVVVIAAIAATLTLRKNETPAPSPNEAAVAAIRVKTIRPQVGTAQPTGVEQPANVAAYYRADLFPQTAGTVTFLEKTVGDAVKAGEKLATLSPVDAALAGSEKTIVRAPFDGVISARSVDPGTFVPSATIVPGTPALLSLMRTDIVTVSMRVPDSFAAYVTPDSEAEIRVDSFPGRALRCKLSRVSPALSASDRTLGVEIDLYNGTAAAHAAFLAREKQTQNADLKSRTLPIFPQGLDASGAAALKPGMFGRMKLIMPLTKNAATIPSSAIVRMGGLAYLYRVEKGVARRAPVQVETDDGTAARVFWIEKTAGQDTTRELAATDEIVATNQGELEDGSPVQTTPAP